MEINHNAQLIVRMPRYASIAEVKRFILEKRAWIEKKLAQANEILEKHAPKKFTDDEEFYYLGEKYLLKSAKGQSAKFKFNNGFFIREGIQTDPKKLFINWYKKQAKLNIPKRVRWHADLHHLKFAKIKITSASRRWGSCTSNGNLNFTWRLMLLPVKILDYVVAHEISHLVHHNHSKRFWAQVEKIIPDYKERRKWLKKNGDIFSI